MLLRFAGCLEERDVIQLNDHVFRVLSIWDMDKRYQSPPVNYNSNYLLRFYLVNVKTDCETTVKLYQMDYVRFVEI